MPATKDQIEAARAQEAEAEEQEYVTVPLAGHDGVTKDVRCMPAGRWRASTIRALNSGEVDTFMEINLHPDDYEIYEELDPTMDGFGKFVADASRISGEALGKSSGPSRSSRSTRKR
ncbi:hypothetical protein [Streptomyces griseoloalbus]|uniref:Uncharacterized protein n=1 Tax=Streptomyces griseoloalbus TaxID=67303 RepID=A0A7W8FC13_9ACTN|nr:hypothetical protein [Streptomyces albaduncus]MBB5129827.1 hypothetical protein [Streptomyces albaduncus]GGW80875.1 hypothetical protein GCM10010340_68750 [Streptomyces albaduncus]